MNLLPAHRRHPAAYGVPARSAAPRDRGQTAIEFVGVVPLILITLAVLWQAGLVCYTYVLAGNAADKAARAAAVTEGSQSAACARAVREDLPGSWKASVQCGGGSGEFVTVKVRLDVPLLFPGAFSLPLHATGEAKARNERRDAW
ncbi:MULTISPECIES: TadE/TadG family type IV pilus assembly protein [unclassified Streptomyces]|uniref:TadE/TadG family type IV pilus assembly protein n=1 Tax=unclassified Streptomyces TaxID=2593676 RepID=UPI000DADE064|nr:MULTISPECIES: TadE/TadG family type IV pilus assembly protein [unclassified Streptomyces]PZT76370.1 pilus assembly protein [Streptomyces sp. AC1-42W]PZT79676.1 pilus assembly protein [Streptomyces sp. AC1-42T]